MWAVVILKGRFADVSDYSVASCIKLLVFDNKRAFLPLKLKPLLRCLLLVCKRPTTPESDAHCLGPYIHVGKCRILCDVRFQVSPYTMLTHYTGPQNFM